MAPTVGMDGEMTHPSTTFDRGHVRCFKRSMKMFCLVQVSKAASEFLEVVFVMRLHPGAEERHGPTGGPVMPAWTDKVSSGKDGGIGG